MHHFWSILVILDQNFFFSKFFFLKLWGFRGWEPLKIVFFVIKAIFLEKLALFEEKNFWSKKFFLEKSWKKVEKKAKNPKKAFYWKNYHFKDHRLNKKFIWPMVNTPPLTLGQGSSYVSMNVTKRDPKF